LTVLRTWLERFDLPKALATGLVLLYGITYAFANAPDLRFHPLPYYMKHAIVVAAAACTLLYPRVLLGPMRDVSLLILVYMVLLAAGALDLSNSLMAGVFFLGAAFMATAFRAPPRWLPWAVLAAVIAIPLTRNLLLWDGSFIYNTYYGRPRLLLGYHHPKEAGNAVVICSLLAIGVIRQALLRTLLITAMMVLLYFIQSRNAIVFAAFFLIVNAIYAYGGRTSLPFFGFAAMALLMVVYATFDFDVYDELMSGRLRTWSYALEAPDGYRLTERTDLIFLSSPTGLDNFFVESYVHSGALGLFAVLVLLLGLVLLAAGRHMEGRYALPLIVGLFLNASFDVGLHSTGNILHVFGWAMAFSAWHTTVPALAASPHWAGRHQPASR
jgi:hypothetical protein